MVLWTKKKNFWTVSNYGTAWCEVSTTKQMICALYALAPLIGRKLEREGPFWASNIYYNIDGIENPMFILLGSSKYSRVRCLGCSVLLLLCSYRGPGFFLGVFSFCVARAQDGRMWSFWPRHGRSTTAPQPPPPPRWELPNGKQQIGRMGWSYFHRFIFRS